METAGCGSESLWNDDNPCAGGCSDARLPSGSFFLNSFIAPLLLFLFARKYLMRATILSGLKS